jgi:hypothetical protein
MALVTSNESSVTMTEGSGGGGGAVPVLTATQTGTNKVTLEWTYTGNADFWRIFRTMAGGNPIRIDEGFVGGALRAFDDTGNMAMGWDAPTAPNTYTYYIQTDDV